MVCAPRETLVCRTPLRQLTGQHSVVVLGPMRVPRAAAETVIADIRFGPKTEDMLSCSPVGLFLDHYVDYIEGTLLIAGPLVFAKRDDKSDNGWKNLAVR